MGVLEVVEGAWEVVRGRVELVVGVVVLPAALEHPASISIATATHVKIVI